MSQDMNALRDYIVYESGGQARGESTVLLHVTHSNLKARMFEIRLDKHMTVERVKEKLRSHTGTGSLFMHLTMLDFNGQVVADMINDELKLGYFSPMDGWTIHITDLDPHSLAANGGLEDVSLVKKYEISDDDYNKREDNFRKWRAGKKAADPSWTLAKEVKQNQDKKRMEQDPNFVPEPAKAPVTDDEHLADLAGGMKVGDRCEVTVGGKRGLVQYVGKIPQIAPGWWVGVQYDEPVGKNDGTVKGRKYFDCPPKYGGFLRPDKLSVGDYPELDDLFTDDEADDEAENAVAAS
jgi:tubulin-folding cofactor B